MNPRRLLAVALAATVGFLGSNLASAGTVNINPSKDNTLYEYDPDIGDLSNALGLHFFAGKTAMNTVTPGRARVRHRWKYSAGLDDYCR